MFMAITPQGRERLEGAIKQLLFVENKIVQWVRFAKINILLAQAPSFFFFSLAQRAIAAMRAIGMPLVIERYSEN
jgi:hypothetical protein